MATKQKKNTVPTHILLHSILSLIIWTLLLGSSLAWNIIDTIDQSESIAHHTLKYKAANNLSLQLWAVTHGNLYMKQSEAVSSPFLGKIVPTELFTKENQRLVLLEPSLIIQEIKERFPSLFEPYDRLISFHPLNPENLPDEWEQQVLTNAIQKKDSSEVFQLELLDNKEYLRLFKPVQMESSCVTCHHHPDWEIGQTMGGISVALAMEPYMERFYQRVYVFVLIHLLIWLIGGIALFVVTKTINKRRLERKAYERNVAESEERLQRIFDYSPVMMHSLDEKLTIREVNKKWLDETGYSRDEVVGLPLELFLEKESTQEMLKTLNYQFRGTGAIQNCPYRYQTKSGSIIEVLVDSTYYKEDHERFIISIGRNVTEQRKSEIRQEQLAHRLEEANTNLEQHIEEINGLTYLIAHDLRTPLRGINQLTDWLLTDNYNQLDMKGKEYLELLKRRVRKMYSLISGIQHYTKAGQINPHKTKINLHELIESIWQTLQPESHIYLDLSQPLPALYSDPEPIREIFHHLLKNAIAAIDKPTGQIQVRCSDIGEYCKFSVIDNGRGIPKRYHTKLFKMFQTLESDNEQRIGIGLAVIRKIITLYGGRIWLESEENKGSRFFFLLPKELLLKESK